MLTLKSSLLALALTAGLTLAAAPAMAACNDDGKPCGCAEKSEKKAGYKKDGRTGGCGDEAGHKMGGKMGGAQYNTADDMDCCGKGGKKHTAAKDSRGHGKPGRAF